MLTSIDRITWRNGFRLNGIPVTAEDIEPVFEGRRAVAMSLWEQYESHKADLRKLNLSSDEFLVASRQIVEALGI